MENGRCKGMTAPRVDGERPCEPQAARDSCMPGCVPTGVARRSEPPRRVAVRAVATLRVIYARSSGFAGVRLGVTVDAATLSPKQAGTLRMLVTAADFFHLPGNLQAAHSQPDRFQHRIEIEDGARRHGVVVDEAATPATLRPLLDWLLAAARRKTGADRSLARWKRSSLSCRAARRAVLVQRHEHEAAHRRPDQ